MAGEHSPPLHCAGHIQTPGNSDAPQRYPCQSSDKWQRVDRGHGRSGTWCPRDPRSIAACQNVNTNAWQLTVRASAGRLVAPVFSAACIVAFVLHGVLPFG